MLPNYLDTNRLQLLSRQFARYTLSFYVCARCWRSLDKWESDKRGVFYVGCGREDCDGQGFVSKRFASSEREKSREWLRLARQSLPDLFKNPYADLTETELLQSLGF